jgi:hypothetical protein
MEWIKCSDRLPNKYERVLVTDGKQVCLHYKQSWCNFEGSEGEDLYPIDQIKNPQGNWANCCHIEEGKITHWTYIDDIPRPDKENQ